MADMFEITFEKMVSGGDCMGRLPDGRALFVPFVLPGETVRVAVVDEKKRYARGWPVEVLSPSPERIARAVFILVSVADASISTWIMNPNCA